MMASSSAHEHHQQMPSLYGATVAPPPTPSSQPNHLSTSDAADSLSRLLHRLPPALSLPSRFSSPPSAAAPCPALASLSDQNPSLRQDILYASRLGFFQLTEHSVPHKLAESAESDALSLLDLPPDQKRNRFPQSWPLGFDHGDEEEEDGDGRVALESFCLDSSYSTESELGSLCEFTRAMERLGLEIIESLSRAVGFENPLRREGEGESDRVTALMWISEGCAGTDPDMTGRVYPYIVGLQYQMRRQGYSLLGDSGRVSVEPQVESVLVTLGDIAQVWSNGKLKKVRGRPMATRSSAGDGSETVSSSSSRSVVMSVLLTLPLESTVRPLPSLTRDKEDDGNDNDDAKKKKNGEEEKMMFKSFSLEDYAWRVYHDQQRLLFNDPLKRYRNF